MSNLRKALAALSTILAVSAMLSVGVAKADAQKLELIAYLDHPGGRQIVSGRYYEAIDLAEAHVNDRKTEHRLVAYTNLCVAQTKVGNFDAAVGSCDMALGLARIIDAGPGKGIRSMPAVARALSNRGVLLYLLGETSAAIDDFATATSLDRAAWDAPMRNNLAYVTASRPDVALARSSR